MTHFSSELARADYQSILSASQRAESARDHYLVIRAAIILGDLSTARRQLAEFRECLGNFLSSFLQLQIDSVEGLRRSLTLLEYLKLANQVPEDDFLRGEFHLMVGYTHNAQDEFQQGIRHHRLACEFYARAGLRAQEAVAWFNLCVSYNHLNEKSLFELAFEQLKILAQQIQVPHVQLIYQRMLVYRLVDREEYEKAEELLTPLLTLARRENRLRELGGLSCLHLYLLIKTKSPTGESFMDSIAGERARFASEHRSVLGELDQVSRESLLNAKTARARIARWKRLNLSGVNWLFLLDILCENLLRSSAYEELTTVARLATRLSIQKQQALCRVDFRYYEVLGLSRSGLNSRAERILTMYRSDAERDVSPRRIQKADAASIEIRQCQKRQTEDSRPLPKTSTLILDPVAHTLVLNRRKKDISRQPLVTRFLALLIQSQGELPIGELFTRLYQLEYNPLRHERRLSSLIDRTRKVLGQPGLVLRREGRVFMKPGLITHLESSRLTEYAQVKRQAGIIKALTQAGQPLPISELESRFDYCRRTLQIDLKQLTATRRIRSTGSTRSRRYFV